MTSPKELRGPAVVIPKPAGDIHLCIDMTRANDVKVLERLPIATVDGGT